MIFTVLSIFSCTSAGNDERGKEVDAISVAYRKNKSMENGSKWSRCFRLDNGRIYFTDSLMSRDGGETLVPQTDLDLNEINGAPERAVLSSGKMFYALDGPTEFVSPGIFRGKSMEIRR